MSQTVNGNRHLALRRPLRAALAAAMAVTALLVLSASASAGTRGIACGTIKVQTLRHKSPETWKVYRVRGGCAAAKRVMAAYQASIYRTQRGGNCEGNVCANAIAPAGYTCTAGGVAQERRLGFVATCHGHGPVYRTYEDSHYAGV